MYLWSDIDFRKYPRKLTMADCYLCDEIPGKDVVCTKWNSVVIKDGGKFMVLSPLMDPEGFFVCAIHLRCNLVPKCFKILLV